VDGLAVARDAVLLGVDDRGVLAGAAIDPIARPPGGMNPVVSVATLDPVAAAAAA